MAEALSSPELPPEILFYNILPRLPAKSLLRFKSVSKEWHSFLKTPLFEKLHLHHATNDDHQNHLKLLIFSYKETETQHKFNVIDSSEKFNQDGLNLSRSFPFEADSDDMQILASFSGLVCVGITKPRWDGEYSDIILWNPLTGEYKTLCKPYFRITRHARAFGLYYSSCDDDYKLLCVARDLKAYIYSLKSDAWRRVVVDSTEDIKHIAAYMHPDVCLWPSITLNEKLYFLKYYIYGQDSTTPSIIRFDTRTENFTEIATPSYRVNRKDVLLSFIVLRGCIHFFVIYVTDSVLCCKKSDREWQHVECWWMDEDGNWIKEVNLPKSSYIIEPLHPIRGSPVNGRACKLDFTSHVIKDIAWPRWWRIREPNIYIPLGGKYLETLVSPTRYEIDEVRQPP